MEVPLITQQRLQPVHLPSPEKSGTLLCKRIVSITHNFPCVPSERDSTLQKIRTLLDEMGYAYPDPIDNETALKMAKIHIGAAQEMCAKIALLAQKLSLVIETQDMQRDLSALENALSQTPDTSSLKLIVKSLALAQQVNTVVLESLKQALLSQCDESQESLTLYTSLDSHEEAFSDVRQAKVLLSTERSSLKHASIDSLEKRFEALRRAKMAYDGELAAYVKISEFLRKMSDWGAEIFSSNMEESRLVMVVAKFVQEKSLFESHCSPLEKEKIEKAFEKIFCNPFASWPSGLISFFNMTQDQRFHLAQKLLRHAPHVAQHIKQFELSSEQRKELAFHFLQYQEGLSRFIDQFEIDDETFLYELADKEIDRKTDDEAVSFNLGKYHLHDQRNLVALAEKAVQKNIQFYEVLKEYHIESEEKRYELFILCARRTGDKVIPFIPSANLTREHRISLAKELGEHAQRGDLITKWNCFQLDTETTKQILFEIATKNPFILFEQWHALPPLDDSDRVLLQQQIPFFELQRIIHTLNQESTDPFHTIQETLTTLLQSLHEINTNSPLPYCFYKSVNEGENEITLSTVIKKIASQCTSQELLFLVTLLHDNYFCGTNNLLHALYLEAVKKYPALNDLTIPFEMDLHRNTHTPLITAQSAHRIVTKKLHKLGLEHIVEHPQVIYIDNLENEVQRFQESSSQKAVFLINFKEGLQGHYSPLILEKKESILHIFNSDSVYSWAEHFTEKIIAKLKKLPFKTELYTLPETSARQSDIYSCPVFSINDIKEAAKLMQPSEGGSFIDYVQLHGHIQTVGEVHQVHSLPIGMIKMTQSLSKLEKLDLQSATFRRKGLHVSLDRYVHERTYVVYDPVRMIHHKANMSSACKAAVYFQKALQEAIKNHMDSR